MADEPHISAAHFAEHAKRVDEGFDGLEAQLVVVLKRQEKQNGTVADLVRWRYFVTGGFAVLTFFVAVFGVYALTAQGSTNLSRDEINCSAFQTQAEAQAFLQALGDDRYRLDLDRDNLPCESLP